MDIIVLKVYPEQEGSIGSSAYAYFEFMDPYFKAVVGLIVGWSRLRPLSPVCIPAAAAPLHTR